jgi:hypothetical protein
VINHRVCKLCGVDVVDGAVHLAWHRQLDWRMKPLLSNDAGEQKAESR